MARKFDKYVYELIRLKYIIIILFFSNANTLKVILKNLRPTTYIDIKCYVWINSKNIIRGTKQTADINMY